MALAVDHREPDRVPIDLGGMKATGINIGAYQRVRDLLGLPGPARVLDPKFMIAEVQEDALRRLHGDVLPVDVTTASALLAPESAWKPRRLFDGREALFPPGTRIAEDPDGSWVLLDAAGARTSFRMPRDGHYFDDIAFNAPRGDARPPELPAGRHRPRGRAAEPRDARPSPARGHRLRPAGLGIRRLLPRPQPDHRPAQQRDAWGCPTSG